MEAIISSVIQAVEEFPQHPINAPLFRCPAPVPQIEGLRAFLGDLEAAGLLEVMDRIYLPQLGENGHINWAGAGDDMVGDEIPRPVGGAFTPHSGHLMVFVGKGPPVERPILHASGVGGALQLGLGADRAITSRMNEGPGNPARRTPGASYAVADALICLNRLHAAGYAVLACSGWARKLTLLRVFSEGSTGVPEGPLTLLRSRPVHLVTIGAGLTDAQLDAFCGIWAARRALL